LGAGVSRARVNGTIEMIPGMTLPWDAYDNGDRESFACDKRPEYAPKLDHAPEGSGLIVVCRLRGVGR